METKVRSATALLLAMAVGLGGCWPFPSSTPLSRASQDGEAAVKRCEDAYANLYRAYKARRVTEETRQKGRTLYVAAQKVALELGEDLAAATQGGDEQLTRDVERARRIRLSTAKLNAQADQIEALMP